MSKTGVTKRGRPRKYKSDAAKQRAYRKRKAKAKAGRWNPQLHRSPRLNPNRVIDATVLSAVSLFTPETIDTLRHPKAHRFGKEELDRARLPEWIELLIQTRRDLNRFIRFLKKL